MRLQASCQPYNQKKKKKKKQEGEEYQRLHLEGEKRCNNADVCSEHQCCQR